MICSALAGAHLRLRKLRPHFRAAFAAGGADKVRFDIRQSHMIGPAVSVHCGRMAAVMIAAIDRHVTDAEERISPKVIFCGKVVMS